VLVVVEQSTIGLPGCAQLLLKVGEIRQILIPGDERRPHCGWTFLGIESPKISS
jgi:hypothetical protein